MFVCFLLSLYEMCYYVFFLDCQQVLMEKKMKSKILVSNLGFAQSTLRLR